MWMLAEAGGEVVPAWGTLVLQAGAFGLLVYIVVRLYPSEAAAARDERERRDRRLEIITTVFGQTLNEAINTLQTKFEERNNRLMQSIEQQTQRIEQGLRDSAWRIEQAIDNAGGPAAPKQPPNQPRRT